MLADGEKLNGKARIFVSTIHAAKGGEEDNVILSYIKAVKFRKESNKVLTNRTKSIECGMWAFREQEIII